MLCIIIIIFVCFVTVLVKLHKSSWEGKLINVMKLKPYVSKLHSFGFYKQLSAFPEQGERERRKKSTAEIAEKKVFLFIQVAGDAHHQRFFRAINNLQREVIFKLAEP